MATPKPKNISEYIGSFSTEIQVVLEEVRTIIKLAAPEAEETISYSIPTFSQNGNLVHFAAFKNHIGFYAFPTSNVAFQNELSNYKVRKGSVQFPLDKPMPKELITKIVKFRIKENLAIS